MTKKLPYAGRMAVNEAVTRDAIGRVLVSLRSKSRMTQQQAAAAIQVRAGTLRGWERGGSEPRVSQLAQLAELYGTRLVHLIAEVEELEQKLVLELGAQEPPGA